jgi:hypothetical protein
MGKVGSSSVYSSLKAANLDMPIHHIHFLKWADINEIEKRAKRDFQNIDVDLLKRLWLAKYIRKLITIGTVNRNKWKIITMVREPISRNIAAFFQSFKITKTSGYDGETYQIKSRHHNFEMIANFNDPVVIERLTGLFFERVNHAYPLNYFDLEMKEVFGIDLYATNFPKTKGYEIYAQKHPNVLLIKLECLEKIACDAFREFLSINTFNLINKNKGDNKEYAVIYKKFKESISIPEGYIEMMYNSKYMQHFYNDEEIIAYADKWRNGQASAAVVQLK